MQIIPITIQNKVASVPCDAYIVADNPDYQLQFAFDGEWSAYPLKTARFLIGSQYTDVDFTGNIVTVPSMPSDVFGISVGVYAGEISTSTPAKIRVYSSVLGTSGTTYDPAEPSVLPDVDELALDDTFVITDVSEGEKARANIGQIVDYVQSASETTYVIEVDVEHETVTNPPAEVVAAFADNTKQVVLSAGGVIFDSPVDLGPWEDDPTKEAYLFAKVLPARSESVAPTYVGVAIYVNSESISVNLSDYIATLATTYDIPTDVSQLNNDAGYVTRSSIESSLESADNAVRFNTQTLTAAQQAQARSNINAASLSDIGTVFTVKGEVTNVSDLPASGNTVGDVYYVSSVQAGYIWLETTDHPNGYWEELGEPIDLSAYAPLASPAFTGTPTAPTASSSTNNTQIATTAFVKSVIPSVPSASSATPQALGTAAAGSSMDYSRADHVHAKPSAEDVGAIAAPASPTSGAFLVWDGTAWTAQTLATWQGGSF